MQRHALVGVILAGCLVAMPVVPVEAARYPDPDLTGFEWYYIFGAQGNPYYGAEAEPKWFFVEVPVSAGPVIIEVLDADIRDQYDELAAGGWNTSTKFSVFGGSTLIDSRTIGPDAPDGTVVRFGPLTPEQGESQGTFAVFRIQVEGLDGNDNNLFAFNVEPAQAQFYGLNPALRLAEHEGTRMRLYPGVPAGTTQLRERNYDLDPTGGSARLYPPGGLRTFLPQSFRLRNSKSASSAETWIDVPQEWTGTRWTYEVTKATQPHGNMSVRLSDQNGQPLPIYFTPGDIRPVVVAAAPKPAPAPAPKPTGACNSFEFDASQSYDPDNQQLAYQWDLGDGTTSDAIRLQHTYTQPGDYRVGLTVTDNSTAECRQSRTEQWLRVNGPPQAQLEAPTVACAGTTVRLSAAKSTDASNDALRYRWDLGDGTTADGAEVTHTYARGGNYQVRLTVDDGQETSCSQDHKMAALSINTPPVAAANDAITVCSRNPLEPLDVTFDATSSRDEDGQRLSYRWDFGDGTTGEGAKVTHRYERGGRYTARLTVDDGSGATCALATASVPVTLNRAPIVVATQNIKTCAGETVAFDAGGSTDPDGQALTYRWDFGDGTTAEGATVIHTFTQGGTYAVRVTADDGSGMECGIATAQLTAQINTPPRAVAKADELGCVSRELAFDAGDSEDADGQRLTYRWDFGDGTTAEGAKVQHAFAKGGTYPVTLTVDDGSGTPCGIATARGDVRINAPPIASAGPNLVCCREDLNVFDASQSRDPDGDALTYRWDFGDGTTAEGAKVEHAYPKNGVYQARVTVTDASGIACGSSSAGFTANVNAAPVAQMAIRGEGGRAIPATAGEPH